MDFVNEEYKRYVKLPDLLKSKGYEIVTEDYSFTISDVVGYIKIDDNLYVKPYTASNFDIKLVVTNDKNWDNTSILFSTFSSSSKAYYFDYKDENQIDELCKCIEAFKEDIAGRIGYYENGKYYNNQDLINFYTSLRKEDNYYLDAWNHHLIQINHLKDWNLENSEEEINLMPNKYTGLEIYLKTDIILNDADQWSMGNISNKSTITFEHDRNKSDKCHLVIENYTYDNDHLCFDYNNGIPTISKDMKHIDTVEFYGTFTELIEILEHYIKKMCEIHEIKL